MSRVKETDDPKIQTAMIYGTTGAGKTRFCATWPRVAWIGSARELGWKTIDHMNPADFYEPGRPPLRFKVTSMQDLANDLTAEIFPRISTGEILTICLEISIYAEDIIRSFPRDMKNGWAKYDTLQEHIYAIDERVKQIKGFRAVYNALAAPGVDDKHPSGMLIPGRKVAEQLPALCELVGYLRAEDMGAGRVERVLHLTPYGSFPARERCEGKLPPLIRQPTFRKMERLLRGEITVDASGNVIEEPRKLTSLPPLKTA